MGIVQVELVTKAKFRQLLLAHQEPVAGAATDAIHDVAGGLKRDVRTHVRANFKRAPVQVRKLGQIFENSFQVDSFPSTRSKKVSLRSAAQLYVAPKFAEIFETGGTISARGKFLVIPLPAAVRAGLDRMFRPSNRLFGGAGASRYSRFSNLDAVKERFGRLRLVPSKSGFVLAVDKQKGTGRALKGLDFVPMFALVRSVTIPKKLDLKPIIRKWTTALPALFTGRLGRRIKAAETAQ